MSRGDLSIVSAILEKQACNADRSQTLIVISRICRLTCAEIGLKNTAVDSAIGILASGESSVSDFDKVELQGLSRIYFREYMDKDPEMPWNAEEERNFRRMQVMLALDQATREDGEQLLGRALYDAVMSLGEASMREVAEEAFVDAGCPR